MRALRSRSFEHWVATLIELRGVLDSAVGRQAIMSAVKLDAALIRWSAVPPFKQALWHRELSFLLHDKLPLTAVLSFDGGSH